MDIHGYLRRIKYDGDLTPNAETLRHLHRAHMFAVPFENLDIHIKRPISLEIDDIYAKLVTGKRGGFCYEQNGLFASILREMGYRVDMMEARVNDGEENFKTPYDHMTLIVHLEERWLADVGFGDSFIEPLRLDVTETQVIDGKSYRLKHDGAVGYYETYNEERGWRVAFRFDMTPRKISDFTGGCHYHQTSPNSHFTQKRVCSLARPDGRITLSDLTFIETINGERQERELQDEAEFTALLKSQFDVALTEIDG